MGPPRPSSLRRVVVAVCAALLVAFVACGERAPGPGPRAGLQLGEARYVGSEACRACHAEAFAEWEHSDHAFAMRHPSPESVLGDFAGAVLEEGGEAWRFERRGEEYWIGVSDRGGESADYPVAYTFGRDPLQQFLVPVGRGHFQVPQVAWDSRPKAQGGQRWFHLYPDEAFPPGDPLHWTAPAFNWNRSCAACHSTGLVKGFDAPTASYDTRYAEVHVGCEACHGPASAHLEWAAAEPRAAARVAGKGLVVDLVERGGGGWILDPRTNVPRRSAPLGSQAELDTCARCHSHRIELTPAADAGPPLLDTHLPSVLSTEIYHADGQVREESFEWGSFVQSRMHEAGVRCSDCHHPHSLRLRAEGNDLCNRCHPAERYDTPAHHFHPPGSSGARCVECHMPTTVFMQVDARRDHGLRSPRPDLSLTLGTPNACNACHRGPEEDAAWAARQFFAWWGEGPRRAHPSESLATARAASDGRAELLALALDPSIPPIVRASALADLAARPLDARTLRSALGALGDPEALVRTHAAELLERLPPAERRERGTPLLADPLRAVRLAAARVLAPVAAELGDAQRAAFERVVKELEQRRAALADHAAEHRQWARFELDRGRPAQALEALRLALRVEPNDLPARVELARLLEDQGQHARAEAELRAALEGALPGTPRSIAQRALGLFLVRRARADEGREQLAAAVRSAPDDAQGRYLLGVARASAGDLDGALAELRRAHALAPEDPAILYALATVARDAGLRSEALDAARQLQRLEPHESSYRALLRELEVPDARGDSGD